jgi:hypothetical protein
LVLYAKQHVVYSFGIAYVITPQDIARRDLLIKAFKVQWTAYMSSVLIVPFVPTVYTIVLSQTAATQGVRIV